MGGTDSFPSLSLSLSPPLFLPICVSHTHSISLFREGFFRFPTTCDFQPRSALLPAPSVCFRALKRRRKVSLISLCVSVSLPVIYLHADTPTQMISRHFLPTEVFRLPVSPQAETICPQSFICMLPKFPPPKYPCLFLLFQFSPCFLSKPCSET